VTSAGGWCENAGVAHDLRFGISRKHGGDRVLHAATSFIDALAAALGVKIKLTVSFDYESLLKAVLGGSTDVVWAPPVVCAHVGTPVAVCSRNGKLTYHSAILVRDTAPFRVPADLRGARLMWTDRHSAAGYLFPRQHLAKAGVDLGSLQESFAGSFIQAAQAVDRGDADATATFIDRTDPKELVLDLRRVFGPTVRTLRVLDGGITEIIPADGIAVSSRLTLDLKTRITGALCRLHATQAGAAALQDLMQADCLVRPTPDVQRAIEDLRRIA
jgi:ABC-type phosphate/phosphonate transport system substrate-binding protein